MIETGKFLRRSFVAAFTLAAPVPAFSEDSSQDTSRFVLGGNTSVPVGYQGGYSLEGERISGFCERHWNECDIRFRDVRPEEMSPEKWEIVRRINYDVNRKVRPKNDIDMHGVSEHWSYPDNGFGDCEDYVLEKRRLLAGQGLSLSNLLITVLRRTNGEGHAVLTLRTISGDFILDNFNNDLKPVHKASGYNFLKILDPQNFRRFRDIKDTENVPMPDIPTASTPLRSPA